MIKGEVETTQRTEHEVLPAAADAAVSLEDVAEATVQAEETEPQVPKEGAPQASRWTPKSRRAIQQESALIKEVESWKGMVRHANAELERISKETGSLLENATGPDNGWAHSALDKVFHRKIIAEQKKSLLEGRLQKEQALLQAYQERQAAFAPERARRQQTIADGAAQVLAIDVQMELQLRAALEILEKRKSLTDELQRLAGSIDLPVNMDNGVFEALSAALSLDLVSATQAWRAVLLGEGEGLKPYVVVTDKFEPQETLARKARYTFGETVYLSEGEAAEYLRNDRPHPHRHFGWECLPPELVTLEVFEQVKAERGIATRSIFDQKFSELEQERRAGYVAALRGTPAVREMPLAARGRWD